MSRKWILGVVIAAAALGLTALAVGKSRDAKGGGVDLTGTWRLDAAKSDLPVRGRFGERGGRGSEGGWGGQDRPRRGRGGRLPRVVAIKQAGGVVAFSDSTGALVQEIRTEESGAPPANPLTSEGVRELTGHWDGGTLIAEWAGPAGGSMEQKISVEDHGRTLEIRMERKGGGGRGGRGAIKMVYRRSS